MAASTERIFGQISAMQTLLENFPMNIFKNKSKNYNSAFDFIIDVLYACGVDTNQIITTILEKIYGVEGLAGSSIDGLLERIKYGNFEVNTQNPFMQKIEESIKIILMGLFTSIFTCSALPILPNKVFDRNDFNVQISGTTEYLMSDSIINQLEGMVIPVKTIDLMGMLSISPTSYDGHLYYLTEGKNKYYNKIEKIEKTIVDVEKTIHPGETYQKKDFKYDFEYPLTISATSQSVQFILTDDQFINYHKPYVDLKIVASVLYEDGAGDLYGTILADDTGGTVTISSPKTITSIVGVIINGREKEGTVTFNMQGVEKQGHIYLDKNHSSIENGINESINWGTSTLATALELRTFTATTEMHQIVQEEVEETKLSYIEIEKSEIPSGTEIVRKTTVPLNVNEESPEYIVSFQGENPNLLYRTYDMNAFIWYALNRGESQTQIGKNQMMWDSRVFASKNSITRNTSEEWNDWYNSKQTEGAEFFYQGTPLNEFMYPIIQLEPNGANKRNLLIHIPSQKYFLPQNRQRYENGEEGNLFAMNSSIYSYDWDYLKNIRILNPKILLSKLVENLFGFTLRATNSFNFNFVENLIRGKMSSAVKNIIEANDLEVEDCYKVFSNEDFDELLNDMLLQRYSATYSKDGNARTFDLDSYINKIDKINDKIQTEGTTTSLTRLVTEITVDPSEESYMDYGFDYGYNMDGGILKNLLFAITMPIIESLFTPQVMLLVVINFELMGVTRLDSFLGNDLSTILNLFFNKILGLTKSIILFIKDKIVEILMDLFYSYVKPLIENWLNVLLLERLEYWLDVLYSAINCLPTMMITIGPGQIINEIDDVDYADIVTPQNIPESKSEC